MDFKQIQELIKTVNKSNISELSIQDGEFQITIKQGGEEGAGAMQQQPAMHMMMPMQQHSMHHMQLPQQQMPPMQGGAPLAVQAPQGPASPADAGGRAIQAQALPAERR